MFGNLKIAWKIEGIRDGAGGRERFCIVAVMASI